MFPSFYEQQHSLREHQILRLIKMLTYHIYFALLPRHNLYYKNGKTKTSYIIQTTDVLLTQLKQFLVHLMFALKRKHTRKDRRIYSYIVCVFTLNLN